MNWRKIKVAGESQLDCAMGANKELLGITAGALKQEAQVGGREAGREKRGLRSRDTQDRLTSAERRI